MMSVALIECLVVLSLLGIFIGSIALCEVRALKKMMTEEGDKEGEVEDFRDFYLKILKRKRKNSLKKKK